MNVDVLPREAVIEYQQIYFRSYGVLLPYTDALKQALDILKFFQTVYKPIKKAGVKK